MHRSLALTVALFLCALSLASAQTLTNGNLETGCFADFTAYSMATPPVMSPGWNLPGINLQGFYGTFASGADSGSCVIDFVDDSAAVIPALTTVTGLTIGTSYTVSFRVSALPSNGDGDVTATSSPSGGSSGLVSSTDLVTDTNWVSGSLVFVATAASETLTFTAGTYALLDTVSVTTTTTGSVVGDPHVTGLGGQKYEFDGKPGSIYNILTDEFVQINTRLGLLRATDLLELPGPLMVELGLRVANHTVMIYAGSHVLSDGAAVLLDNRPMIPSTSSLLATKVLEDTAASFDGKPATVTFERFATGRFANTFGLPINDRVVGRVFVTIPNRYRVTTYLVERGYDDLQKAWFTFYPRRSLDVSVDLLDQSLRPHGIFGQSAHEDPRARRNGDGSFAIEGTFDDYRVEEGLFGTDFAFNRFDSAK